MSAVRRRSITERMVGLCWLTLVITTAFSPCVQGAGTARSENFSVSAPTQETAEAILARAEALRKEIALQWLGEELKPGDGRTMLTVIDEPSEDRGLTWPIDCAERRYHQVWLWGPSQALSETTMRHEMTHVVFATRFGDRLPAWVNEGIASLSDDPQRKAIGSRIVREMAQTGRWPSLALLFSQSSLPSSDQGLYAASTSLVEFLLGRADRTTLLRFALSGKAESWESALQKHYGFRSPSELEQAWQSWVVQQVGIDSARQPVPRRHN